MGYNVLIDKNTGKVIRSGFMDLTDQPDYDPTIHEVIDGADEDIKIYEEGKPYHEKVGDDFVLHQIDFEDLKKKKLKEINNKTQEMIRKGFTFDGNNFSLSEQAQLNWIVIKTHQPLFTDPVSVTNKDEDEYLLAVSDIDDFFNAGVAVKKQALDSGRALKVSVNAAKDQTELDAIIDNR